MDKSFISSNTWMKLYALIIYNKALTGTDYVLGTQHTMDIQLPHDHHSALICEETC